MSAANAPFEILEISDFCDELKLASAWINAEWASREGETLEQTELWCTQVARSPDEALFIARTEGKTVGCGALLLSDLPIREDLRPWGACLYVLPEYRHTRVGAGLMRRIRDTAKSFGYEWLYLWAGSDRLVETYKRKGFAELDRLDYSGKPIVILRSHIDAFQG